MDDKAVDYGDPYLIFPAEFQLLKPLCPWEYRCVYAIALGDFAECYRLQGKHAEAGWLLKHACFIESKKTQKSRAVAALRRDR